MKYAVLVLLLVGFTPANAQSETACDVSAYYYRYQATEGLNLRAGAGTNFRVVKTLPKSEQMYFTFDIAGEKNGWFRIKRAADKDGNAAFSGDAWIKSEFLAITIPYYEDSGGARVFASPDLKSNVKFKLLPEKEYGIKGCRGSWVKTEYENKAGKMDTGWIQKGDYCGNMYDCASY